MVDLPEPDGAEKIISFPLAILHHIQHLFLNLFQFILHLHHNVLHLSLIAFAAGGVDFTSHLLSYESPLLALPAVSLR